MARVAEAEPPAQTPWEMGGSQSDEAAGRGGRGRAEGGLGMAPVAEAEPPAQTSWEMALSQLDNVAALLRLDPAVREVLRYPQRELTGNFPARLDGGSRRVW